MMKLDRHTILYRKDERGVIVESRTFGPDDDIPDGFEKEVGYERLQQARVVEHKVGESKLTPWDTARAEQEAVTDSSDEVDEGTPRQAREQAGGDLTGAEKEADEALEADAAPAEAEEESEVDEGTPREAREQAGEKLTGAEEEADEADDEDAAEEKPDGRRRSNRRS